MKREWKVGDYFTYAYNHLGHSVVVGRIDKIYSDADDGFMVNIDFFGCGRTSWLIDCLDHEVIKSITSDEAMRYILES